MVESGGTDTDYFVGTGLRLGTGGTTRHPGRGRQHYLPESVYFEAQDFPRQRAAREVAKCVAQWATRYDAFPVGAHAHVRGGSIPKDAGARAALIDELFDWIEGFAERRPGAPGTWTAVGLVLSKGRPADRAWPHGAGSVLLDQHDGPPALVALTPDEFDALRDHLDAQGLPRDLYYPAHLQRTDAVPVGYRGGVVLETQRFSPRAWERREAEGAAPPVVPSERERRASFAEACRRFADALALRIRELTEPGQATPDEDVQWLRELEAHVTVARLAAEGHDVSRLRRRLGWGGRPEVG